MTAHIPPGTHGWFETKFRDADTATFAFVTTVNVEPVDNHWVRTVGQVPGFPPGHPPILLNRNDVEVRQDGC